MTDNGSRTDESERGLREAVAALADQWRAQRAEYPLDDMRGSVAFTAVRLCEEELTALLAEHPPTPAEEVTGDDVEALAKALGDIRVANARQADWWTDDAEHSLLVRVLRVECVPWAEGLLASDWLRDHDAAVAAKARGDALRGAADDAYARFMSGKTLGAPTDVWLRDRADREQP